MSDGVLIIGLVVGAPLTILALSCLVVALKIFRGGGAEERLRLLEAARRLEESLGGLETRLAALEDILNERSGL